MFNIRFDTKTHFASFTPRALALVLYIYLIEIIVGGPGQWQLESLPPMRHLLFFMLVATYALDLAVRSPTTTDVFTVAWIGTLLAGWAVLLPILNDTPLSNALSDGRPLLALVAAPIALRLLRSDVVSADNLLHMLFALSAIVVVLHILFAINLYINGHRIGQDAAEIFFCLHVQCPGIYVGGMPGGGLRVHWIGSVFMLFFAAETFYRRTIGWVTLFALALYFSWSRSLWIASFIVLVGMAFILRRRFPWHLVIIMALVFMVADVAITWRANLASGGPEGVNIFNELALLAHGGMGEIDFKSESMIIGRAEQEGLDIRIEQLLSHLKIFASNPITGTGFGVAADIVRSTEAPWSSESTYTALAYKLGLIGLLVTALPLILLWRRLRSQAAPLNERQRQLFVVAFSFLLMSAFNPYLINFVGMTFVAVLYAIIWWDMERTT
jgi:hypothetical protein